MCTKQKDPSKIFKLEIVWGKSSDVLRSSPGIPTVVRAEMDLVLDEARHSAGALSFFSPRDFFGPAGWLSDLVDDPDAISCLDFVELDCA